MSTTTRLIQLRKVPTKGSFDVAHLKAIHRHIFQDVFDWAGTFRTVNISKGGHLFGAAGFLEAALGDMFWKLSKERRLTGTSIAQFAERAGFYLGELNAAHPFREGNGRTQREFIRQLGACAGHDVDWRRVTRAQMIAASKESCRSGDNTGLVEIMRGVTCGVSS